MERRKKGRKKKVRIERVEGEPRRIGGKKGVTGRYVSEKERDREREREIHKIQSTDVRERVH